MCIYIRTICFERRRKKGFGWMNVAFVMQWAGFKSQKHLNQNQNKQNFAMWANRITRSDYKRTESLTVSVCVWQHIKNSDAIVADPCKCAAISINTKPISINPQWNISYRNWRKWLAHCVCFISIASEIDSIKMQINEKPYQRNNRNEDNSTRSSSSSRS